MNPWSELDVAAYLSAQISMEESRRKGEEPARWAVLVSREWAEKFVPEE